MFPHLKVSKSRLIMKIKMEVDIFLGDHKLETLEGRFVSSWERCHRAELAVCEERALPVGSMPLDIRNHPRLNVLLCISFW